MLRDHSTGGGARKADAEGEESSSPEAELADKEAALADELERKLNEKVLPQRVNNVANNSGIVANDQTQCKIIAANKKMLFIISKDNFLFKRGCLTKSIQVRFSFIIFASLHSLWSMKSYKRKLIGNFLVLTKQLGLKFKHG